LGAFDFATQASWENARMPSSVGFMGFGFGGLAAQTAFGLERDARGLLLAGGVHDVWQLVKSKVDSIVSSSVGWVFYDSTWRHCRI